MLLPVEVMAIVIRSEYDALPQGFGCCDRDFGAGVCPPAGLCISGNWFNMSSRLLVDSEEANERGDPKLSISSSSLWSFSLVGVSTSSLATAFCAVFADSVTPVTLCFDGELRGVNNKLLQTSRDLL